jgi:hypothetical protein
MRPLQELVREQESHILDLQREVDTLRHAINDYQKEIERLDAIRQDDDLDGEGGSSRLLLERKVAMEEEAETRLIVKLRTLCRVVVVDCSRMPTRPHLRKCRPYIRTSCRSTTVSRRTSPQLSRRITGPILNSD